MVNKNEIIMLLLCIGVIIFVISKHREYKRIPHWKLLMTGFYMFFGSVIFTLAEGIIWKHLLNIIEHVFCLLSAFFMLLWCWLTFQCDQGDK